MKRHLVVPDGVGYLLYDEGVFLEKKLVFQGLIAIPKETHPAGLLVDLQAGEIHVLCAAMRGRRGIHVDPQDGGVFGVVNLVRDPDLSAHIVRAGDQIVTGCYDPLQCCHYSFRYIFRKQLHHDAPPERESGLCSISFIL